ncbi:LysR family transcriptional regulator [Microvirga sp. HBU67558]|uniref:LysR family transcriptional regulator n=1 Tax=Microvirga TaxID=186650 RepID=UPI001B35DF01|nr:MULTISPECIES: LysR family transcriptional regulator [unclassified Microvirga]MBQ0821391.1 LysR family transcriptional regulator [Microvirga sp. HBU67558]
MSINFEALDLRAFVAVVDLEGFHRAAEALNLSQPALSRRIQRLEAAVGAALLERTTRRVALTNVGREFLPLVRRMLDEFDSSLFAMREIGQQRGGQITLACVPTAAYYFLPGVIARFKEQYPNIRFRILDLSANEGLESVARGEVEFGINLLGGSDPELSFEPLLEDPFVLACRRDHPLAARQTLTWSDLEGQPLVAVSRSSGNRILLDAALVRAGVRLSWSYEVTHLSTSLGLVEAGLGISVLPRLATPQAEHPIIVTRAIGDPEVSRTIGVVRRRGARLAPAAERFLEMLLGTWRSPG